MSNLYPPSTPIAARTQFADQIAAQHQHLLLMEAFAGDCEFCLNEPDACHNRKSYTKATRGSPNPSVDSSDEAVASDSSVDSSDEAVASYRFMVRALFTGDRFYIFDKQNKSVCSAPWSHKSPCDMADAIRSFHSSETPGHNVMNEGDFGTLLDCIEAELWGSIYHMKALLGFWGGTDEAQLLPHKTWKRRKTGSKGKGKGKVLM